MKVVELRQTCGACPSQWEGRTDDGKWVYVRYRFGWLSVRVGEGEDVRSAVNGDEVFGKACGGELDGWMGLADLILHTPEIEWPAMEAANGESS